MIVRHLFSAKQVGTLYHYTGYPVLLKILQRGFLKAGNSLREDHPMTITPREKENFISTTRDKNFHRTHHAFVNSSARLVLDGDKISEKYHIFPYNYYWDNYDPENSLGEDPRFEEGQPGFEQPERMGPRPEMDESEEVIALDYSPGAQPGRLDLLKYLLGVDLIDKGEITDNMMRLRVEDVKRFLKKMGLPDVPVNIIK